MNITITSRDITPNPPPKTYTVTFEGLTYRELGILRMALSSASANRRRLPDKAVREYAALMDRACADAQTAMCALVNDDGEVT